MSHQQNLTRIKVVHASLEELADEVVFVGGATVSLYADRAFTEARPTDDVDILVEIFSHKDYAVIEEKLRAKGFENDIVSGVICRYVVKGIIVDVMPVSGKVLGFTNKWYTAAYGAAQHIKIDENVMVKIFDPVYFLAVKMEAYKSRGGNDGRTSTDFEDIIFILNKRNTIWEELNVASNAVKKYLKESFRKWLKEKYLEEWISCHVDFEEQKRVNIIMGGLMAFTQY